MKQVLLASMAASLFAPLSASADQITLLDAYDYVRETTSEDVAFPGPKGDRFVEPYQALVRSPTGTTSSPHAKIVNMFRIILQGEMIHYADGESLETARAIGPGSYYSTSSGLGHISACVSDEPCIAYLYHDRAFDFMPVTQ